MTRNNSSTVAERSCLKQKSKIISGLFYSALKILFITYYKNRLPDDHVFRDYKTFVPLDLPKK